MELGFHLSVSNLFWRPEGTCFVAKQITGINSPTLLDFVALPKPFIRLVVELLYSPSSSKIIFEASLRMPRMKKRANAKRTTFFGKGGRRRSLAFEVVPVPSNLLVRCKWGLIAEWQWHWLIKNLSACAWWFWKHRWQGLLGLFRSKGFFPSMEV